MSSSQFRPSGYDPNEYFFASKFRQGGRVVYSVDFSVREIVTYLPRPNADKPLDVSATQRQISPKHAKDFGEYVRSDSGWVSPALLLRAPNIFQFDRSIEVETGTTMFGQLAVPKDARDEIQIVDGQHRTLGFHLAWESLRSDIENARVSVARAKEIGDSLVAQREERRLHDLIHRRDSLANERVAIQIIIVETPEVARRIFVDINDNAKGITGAVKSRFDDRKVLSRALNLVLQHSELLEGRVNLEQDRITGATPYLLGAKHVQDILKALVVGGGNITPRIENEVNEQDVVDTFDDFATALVDAFPDLAAVQAEDLTPSELRGRSLIGSNVMLRGFARAWFELTQRGWTSQEIGKAFGEMSPHMSAPVLADPADTWFATGLFPSTESGAFSPTSRAQDFKALATFVVHACEGSVRWHRVER
ncbi:DNA sulfur modification protein DndB [Luteipulveratus flavus]|uniref:DNA sulfur modification protein DndB n=1 Tax=Luteipulveratus flavus TaxID=3031728 RepID=A0ABT6C4X0_9MICO|nr:DNA sulfur modification protein DndB [Luteipulveratus sp. YIM 133296]MDF8263932.1 DNA sulfur modification protein DndB [Luteipulveratus sp. YIM 133296]